MHRIDNEMFCFAALADVNDDKIYSDLLGCFPVWSYVGYQYIFTAYVYTINAILMEPMEGMDVCNMIAVFKDIYKELEIRNFKPKLHGLDNQCSKAVISYIKKEKVNIQLVEPHNHVSMSLNQYSKQPSTTSLQIKVQSM